MKAEIKNKQVDDDGHVIIKLLAPADNLSSLVQNALGYLGSELGLGPDASYESLCERCGRERADEMIASLLMEECANVASGNLVLPIACSPKLELCKPYTVGDDLEFSFETYLLPRGKLSSIDPVHIDATLPQLDQGLVEARLEQMRRKHAKLEEVEVEREARAGDVAKVNTHVEHQGAPIGPLCREGSMLELGGSAMPPGFIEGVLGMKVGETREFSFAAPSGKPGQEESFDARVTLLALYERELPELDDAWVRLAFPGFTDLDMLKDAIAQELLDSGKYGASLEDQAESELISRLRIDIPEGLARFATKRRMEVLQAELEDHDSTLESYLASQHLSLEGLEAGLQEQAIWEMKRAAALDALYDELELALAGTDVDEVVDALGMGDTQEAKRELVLDGKMHIIVEQARREKAHRWLMDNAVCD